MTPHEDDCPHGESSRHGCDLCSCVHPTGAGLRDLVARLGFVRWGPPEFPYRRDLADEQGIVNEPTKAEWLTALTALQHTEEKGAALERLVDAAGPFSAIDVLTDPEAFVAENGGLLRRAESRLSEPVEP